MVDDADVGARVSWVGFSGCEFPISGFRGEDSRKGLVWQYGSFESEKKTFTVIINYSLATHSCCQVDDHFFIRSTSYARQ